jgi:hypothetical protein
MAAAGNAVSDPMRRRISAALDAGEMPQMRGSNLRLASVVLQRADGRDAPAMAEVERQMTARGIPLEGAFDSFGPSAPVRRGRGVYARDGHGNERMIARRVGGENRVTVAGRRFYRQPYTRWVVHIPTYRERTSTGGRFHHDAVDVTSESLGLDPRGLQARGSEVDQRAAVSAAVDALIAAHGGAVPHHMLGAEASRLEPGVEVYIDRDRQPTISVSTTYVRDGGLTVDTMLDRVVFGEPILAEDTWQLGQLHEVSRRRSGECGVDVIVASAQRMSANSSGVWRRKPLMTADAAAQALVKIAKEIDPDGALARASFKDVPQTAEITAVDESSGSASRTRVL